MLWTPSFLVKRFQFKGFAWSIQQIGSLIHSSLSLVTWNTIVKLIIEEMHTRGCSKKRDHRRLTWFYRWMPVLFFRIHKLKYVALPINHLVSSFLVHRQIWERWRNLHFSDFAAIEQLDLMEFHRNVNFLVVFAAFLLFANVSSRDKGKCLLFNLFPLIISLLFIISNAKVLLYMHTLFHIWISCNKTY